MNNEKTGKKILVIGLGPIGGICAAHLASASHEVYGVDIWQEPCAKIREDGIVVKGLVSLTGRLAGAFSTMSALPAVSFDYVIIALKTPALPAVADDLSKLGGGFSIVSFQNGLDTEEYLTERFPRERVMRVCVNYAGNMISPGVINMIWFNRPNHLGCLCGKESCRCSEELSSVLTDARLDTIPVTDIKYHTWKKTILNVGLSPLSAITGMTMAEVLQFEETFNIVKHLLGESIAVAGKAGFDYGEGFLDECLGYLSKGGHHKPSMLIAMENGNKTEIDFLNGKIVSFGRECGVPVPVNATVTALVKAMEMTRSRIKCSI
jgi:2-dehydropantoate 2-reductase